MRHKVFESAAGTRTMAIVFDRGEVVMESLLGLAGRMDINGAAITGIGAFESAVLRYFDWDRKDYIDIAVDEQVEVASLIGDIGRGPDGAAAIHIHLVLGRRDGSAVAGHLKDAKVRPTLELVVTETPALCRQQDAESGLNLIDLGGTHLQDGGNVSV